jgi:hypothetical protein
MMSVFQIPKNVITSIDRILNRFQWQTDSTKKRFALLRRSSVCRKKKYGGLGILNLSEIHLALLTKGF